MKELGINYDVAFRHEIEKKVLGSIMAFAESPNIQTILRMHNLLPSDFRAPIHKEIFKAILECLEKTIAPNIINVTQFRPLEYRDNNSRHWNATLIELVNPIFESASLETHIMLLKQFVIMDFWNVNCNNVLYGNWNDKDVIDVSDNIVNSYNRLFKRLTEGIKKDKNQLSYEEEIMMKVNRYNSGKPVGISTTVEEIDRFTAGWSLGELVIIAARPGMGKTTFALITAWNASQNGVKTVFFSLEMPRNQLISKLVSLITGLDYKRIKAGALTVEELQMVLKARKIVENSNLLIDDKVRTIEDIAEKSAEYTATFEARLFFMDYIQRCTTRTKMEVRLMIIEITRELKTIAKGHYVAFIALSQLSRAVERRDNKRPMLSDLKESSSIEEDADIVGFLYCQAYYDKQVGQEPGLSELFHTEFIIGKGRDIGTTTIHLYIDPIKMFVKGYRYDGQYE